MDSAVTILQINTALNEASVSIGRNGVLMTELINGEQHEHVGFIQPAIKKICSSINIELHDLSAVAVMNGPGSYTGLRVGLSSAKGICFALGIPLICINTLEWIALGNIRQDTDLVCPMIDARRMEVFTGLYDHDLNVVMPPRAMVLECDSFATELSAHRIQFCGTGAPKWNTMANSENAHFYGESHDATHFSKLAHKAYEQRKFADLKNSEPFYLKAFYTNQRHHQP